MSNLEHYFENLLFNGEDCREDVNKNTLTKEKQEAVEICAQYVIWSIFDGREEFKNFIKQEFEPIKRGRWIKNEDRSGWHCSCCGKDDLYAYPYTENNERELQDFYCPNCGAKMDEVEE